MTPRGRAGSWGGLALEAGGALVLVLVLFWLFILFLYALFPSGTPVKELMESRRELEPGDEGGSGVEATLTTLLRNVRCRRGNSIAWGDARTGMKLYSQDAVQTFDRSGAGISFGGGDRLSVGSNSMVVVTRLEPEEPAGPRAYRVQVEGEVSGTLSAERKLRMEFAAEGHLARIRPGAARFRFSRKEEGGTLAVYAGEAQVKGRRGMVRVPANHGVTLRKGVAVEGAVPLPAPPALLGGDRALYKYRLLPPRVRFSWSGAAGDYHFQLSRDPRFKSTLIDQRVAAPEFSAGKLGKGSYFWRVSRVEQGMEGNFSRVGSCELQQLLKAPELQVAFPPERVAPGPYTLSGSMEPGSRIFVDGEEVATGASGSFRRELRLRAGVNLIRVEAIDAAGNASYASRIVYGGSQWEGSGPGNR